MVREGLDRLAAGRSPSSLSDGEQRVSFLSTLPPFLDVETEDEFAHSRRQAPLLNRRDWTRFGFV